MDKICSEIGGTLFKYAAFVYDAGSPFRVQFGDWLFKLAAWVSPDKK